MFYTLRNGIRQQMSDDNVARFMKNYGKMAKEFCTEVPGNLHPHLFRHSRAIQNGSTMHNWKPMIFAYDDTDMKRDAIQKATGCNNPLKSNEQTPCWKGDDQIIRRLYGYPVF